MYKEYLTLNNLCAIKYVKNPTKPNQTKPNLTCKMNFNFQNLQETIFSEYPVFNSKPFIQKVSRSQIKRDQEM